MLDLNLLWLSNSPHSPTGYGNQTDLFTPRIKELISKITLFSFYGREAGGKMVNHHGIVELSRDDHPYGADVVKAHYHSVGANLLFTLIDFWVYLDAVKAMQGMNIAAWVPIDSMPMKWADIEALQALAKWKIAMSRFGETMLLQAGFNRDEVLYCPHGIDTNIFTPGDRDFFRSRLSKYWNTDLTDTFLIIDVAANKGVPSRKNFAGGMLAVAEFRRKNPGLKIAYYLHTDPTSRMGENLHKWSKACGLDDIMLYPDQFQYRMNYLPGQYLNEVYNAADVMLHPALGGGFEIPLVEAQAAGCPVVVTDATAMSELVFSGKKVQAIPINMGMEGSFQFQPMVGEMVEGLQWAADNKANETIRIAAREGALQYDVDRVFKEYMQPVLTQIASDLRPKTVRKIKRNVPDVSVIFPVLNASGYPLFDKAIESTLAQEGVNVEIIAVDDGSTDDTWERLQAWAKKDNRVKPVRHDVNKGGSEASNTAASHARGRYFIIQSARSWYEQGSFKAFVQALDNNPAVGFVYGATQYHGASNQRHIPPALYDQAEFMRSFVSLFGYMYRREAWDKGCRYKWYLHVEDKFLCIGDRHIQMEMITKLNYEGLALPHVLALNYFYSGVGQMDTLLKKYQSEMDAKWRENFPMAVSGA